LANDSQQIIKAFVKKNSIPWPCGYGAKRSVMASWGTASDLPDNYPLGFIEPMPTIYVVGSNGVIRWHDKQARYGHCDPADMERDLENAVAEVLADSAGIDPSQGR
jgi:hypothetical protein